MCPQLIELLFGLFGVAFRRLLLVCLLLLLCKLLLLGLFLELPCFELFLLGLFCFGLFQDLPFLDGRVLPLTHLLLDALDLLVLSAL